MKIQALDYSVFVICIILDYLIVHNNISLCLAKYKATSAEELQRRITDVLFFFSRPV